MCTYTFTFDDRLMERISPQFSNSESMRLWLQREIEILLMYHADSFTNNESAKKLDEARKRIMELSSGKKLHGLKDLKGILSGSTSSIEELQDDYLKEKYSL